MTHVEKVSKAFDIGKIVVDTAWASEKPSTASQQVFFWTNCINFE